MSVTFREACEGDAAGISAVLEELGYERSAEHVLQRIRDLATVDSRIFVGESEGAIVACAQVYEAHTLLSERQAIIGGFVVSLPFRGQGVGKALMREAERWALRRGLGQLRL